MAEPESGDTVIVKELTRVSRSTSDMLDWVHKITTKGCYIKSLNENWLDTSSPAGELMLTIFAGMAQFERKLMLQRCAEGRAVAVDKGTKMGRPRTGVKQLEYALKCIRTAKCQLGISVKLQEWQKLHYIEGLKN